MNFCIAWIIIDLCWFDYTSGSIGPEPLSLVLHEAEVPWQQTISAMTLGLSRKDALGCGFLQEW